MFKITVFLISMLAICLSIPYDDQICLANSLYVGRNSVSQPQDWDCKVCDQSNKPKSTATIEDRSVDVKSIVSVYDDFVVLAFRYTNTALNVWEDMLYPLQITQKTACSNCKVQKQFIKMWETIKKEVIEEINNIQQNSKLNRLHITGISLGGALATIAFTDLTHLTTFISIKVTTFGAPRVGNKNWASYYELLTLGRTKRYVVEGDPIPELPRCMTSVCQYHQVGIKIECYDDSQNCIEKQEINVETALSKLFRRLERLFSDIGGQNMGSIIDHIDGYPKIYNHTLIQE